MQPWFTSELQPLYEAPFLFASRDPHETMIAGSRALEEHALVWRSGQVDSFLRHLQLGHLSLYLLRYGAEVQVTSETCRGFVLFQVPLAGSAHITVGDARIRADTDTGVIVSPKLPLELEWNQGCEQLLLKMPVAKLEQACQGLFQTELNQPLQFEPKLVLNTSHGRAWQHLLAALLSWFRSGSKAASPQWLQAHEDMLVQHLLLSQPHNYSHFLLQPPQPTRRSVRLAEDYIQAHLADPIDVATIAQAAGSSVSGISAAFKDRHGLSLMNYVREQRLAGAHAELLSATPETRVTDVALKWGFNHLGRFCAIYRERFGQTPAKSLRQ